LICIWPDSAVLAIAIAIAARQCRHASFCLSCLMLNMAGSLDALRFGVEFAG
jgi:hypothetical protein